MNREDFFPYLERVQAGQILDADTTAHVFKCIMAGQIPEEDLTGFLLAMAKRDPAPSEIVGAVRVMRANMLSIESPPYAIDLCGTGGDGHSTLNISTAVSMVVAAAGVPVAKHGNRNMSSKTGAADVLEALGVKIALTPKQASECLRTAGLCFLFAQTYHPAMKNVAEVRKQIGVRTIFNLLGPLSNPARVRRQLVGVYSRTMLEPMAEALRDLGAEKVWVVHGHDGMDEITTTEATSVAVLENGKITLRELTPENAGLPRASLAAIKGGEAGENASAIRRLLGGEPGPYRDIVLLNAAGALIVAGKADDLKDGVALAAQAIDNGDAQATLQKLIECSNA